VHCAYFVNIVVLELPLGESSSETDSDSGPDFDGNESDTDDGSDVVDSGKYKSFFLTHGRCGRSFATI